MVTYKSLFKLIFIISIFSLLTFSFLSTINAANVTITGSTESGIKGAINGNTIKNGDTILLTPGNYTGSNNVGITLNKNVTIQGNGAANSVRIDGQKKTTIFTISNNTYVTFINITFINGNNTVGGAVNNYNPDSKISFINCIFINNDAYLTYNGGGAIYNDKGTCTISNSTFINNTASFGGAIYNNDGTCTISNSVFTNNTARYGGGGIYNDGTLRFMNGVYFNTNAVDNVYGSVRYVEEFSTNLNMVTTVSYDKITITVTITANGLKIKGSTIYFYVNGKKVGSAKTNNNGVATYTYTAQTGGIYKINAQLPQYSVLVGTTNENVYLTSNATKSLSIILKTSLIINTFKALYKKSNTMSVKIFSSNGKVLGGKQINFYVNGKFVTNARTNSAGVANFKYIFKNRKAHKIEAKFEGDTYYFASKYNRSVIPKDMTYLNLTKFAAKKGKKAILKVTLKNHLKKPMKKRVIKFYSNGKYIGKAMTNSKGVAILQKKITKKGVFTFIAKYEGTKNYHISTYTRKVTVK